MTAGDHLRAIRGRWHIVVAAVVVAVAVAWWSAPGRTPAATYSDPEQVHVESYTATHTLIQDLAPGGASQTPTLNVKLLGALAQRGDIPRRVVERLGLEEAPAAVASRLQITPEPDLGMITITASEPDGERAAQLANAFGEEILAYAGESAEALRQDALEFTRTLVASQRRRIEELNAAISRLPQDSQDAELVVVERDALLAAYGRSLSRLEDLSTGAASPGLVTLTAAVPIPVIAEAGGSSPIQAVSDPTTRLRLAILIGLLLGAGLALLLERVDPRVRSRRQAEEAFGLPVIADVRVRGRVAGALRRWFARRRPTMSAVATAAVPYERLRLDVQRRPRWVLPPPSPGAGLPDAAPRVSALAVHDPVRVVLVTSAVDGEGRAEVFEQLASSFRAAGNEVASIVDQGGGARSAERLRAARDRFDVVLVDGGPLLLASHAAAAISEVDAVVVVSRLGRTSMADAALAREQLAALQAPVLGVVLNGRRGSTGLLPTRGRPRRAGHAWVARPRRAAEPGSSPAAEPQPQRSGEGSWSGVDHWSRTVEEPSVAAGAGSQAATSSENGMLPRAWLIEVYENLRTEAGLGRPAGDRPTVHPRGGSDQRRDLPWIDAAGAVDGRQVRPADGDGHGTNGESEHETGAAPWRMQD